MTDKPYPDTRPLFPLALASLKPGLQQLAADQSCGDFYLIGKERGGSVLLRYAAASGLTTPIMATKGIGNSIGYGGQSYDVHDGKIALAWENSQIALLSEDGQTVTPITPRYEGIANPKFCGPGGKWLMFVARHLGRQQVMITDGESQPVPLSDPAWFAFDPVMSSDGKWLAWQQWQSHEMPFLSATIQVASLSWAGSQPVANHHAELTHTLNSSRQGKASLCYPAFSPDSQTLAYCSDHEGRRQIYLLPVDQLGDASKATALAIGEGEVGDPSWVYGQQPFRFLTDDKVIWRHSLGLSDKLMITTISAGQHQLLHDDGMAIAELAVARDGWAFIAERSDSEPQLLLGRRDAEEPARPVLSSKRGGYSQSLLQPAERLPLVFDGDQLSEGLFLPPRQNAEQERYPLVVFIHGGPTARVTERFRADWQYLASRGIGILAINHRGSGGHGRVFQDLLQGQWGEVDCADAKAAAQQALKACDQLDPNRVFIMGGSAGGYTTLMALCVDREFWAGGICLYGIADQVKLAETTHPFERPYNPYLLGDDDGESWRRKSPAYYEPAISSPVLIFHGRKDKAVPIGPMEDFHAHLLASGNREAELVIFDDEGHGFRRPASIERLLEQTLAFIAQQG